MLVKELIEILEGLNPNQELEIRAGKYLKELNMLHTEQYEFRDVYVRDDKRAVIVFEEAR
jgi:hypothetical protein